MHLKKFYFCVFRSLGNSRGESGQIRERKRAFSALFLISQLSGSAALILYIDVRINLSNPYRLVAEDRLYGTQLCTATDQIGGVGVSQLVRGELAHRQIGKEGFILPTEAARRHVSAAYSRHDIDARLLRLFEVYSEFITIGDITHLSVLRSFYGRIFALCRACDNPAHGDDLFLLANIAPAQPHHFLRAQTGKEHQRDRSAERLVQITEDGLDLVRRKHLYGMQWLFGSNADSFTWIFAAQLILHGRFHDLVDGNIKVMPGTLAQVGCGSEQFFNVDGFDLIQLLFTQRRLDVLVPIQLVVLIGTVGYGVTFDFKPFLALAGYGFPFDDLFVLVHQPFIVGGLCQRFGAAAERFLHTATIRQIDPHTKFPAAVRLFSKTSVHNRKTPFLPEKIELPQIVRTVQKRAPGRKY